MRIWSFALVAAAIAATLGAMNVQRAFAAEEIGSVRTVLVYAYGTPPVTSRRPLYVRDDLVVNEVVETVKKGALHIGFLDGSEFRLGASSRATLDKFVYDPASKAGELTLSLKEGIFRLKTGKMKKEGILVVTPVATIRVTGTDVIILVLPIGAILVAVLDGGVYVSPLVAAVAALNLNAPATARIDSDGTVTPGVDVPRSDPGLANIPWLQPAPRGDGGSRSSSRSSSSGGSPTGRQGP